MIIVSMKLPARSLMQFEAPCRGYTEFCAAAVGKAYRKISAVQNGIATIRELPMAHMDFAARKSGNAAIKIVVNSLEKSCKI